MHITTPLLVAVATLSSVTSAWTVPYFAGFNVGANGNTGACKGTADYDWEFQKIKSWGGNTKGGFTVIKMFSTNDCNQLALAIPAAKKNGLKLWPTVWAVDYNKFTAEKAALERAIKNTGSFGAPSSWLQGVTVGSESFYRGEISAQQLASQIYDVKGMVQTAYKVDVPVGCADTWTSWVNGAFAPVVAAVDVVLVNGFPYWQGATIAQAYQVFIDSYYATKNAVGSKPMVVGETGWPTGGPNFGNAVPSVANAQTYWKGIACWLQWKGWSWFWFSDIDAKTAAGVEANFGVAYYPSQLKFQLKC